MHPSPFPDNIQAALTTALADRYSILRELGRGGMAIVFLAEDLRHQRQVAIKVLLPELGAVLGVERFLSEIRVTARLQHPNLLPLFDSGEAGGLLYYVMPFVEGETLRARLDREQQLPVEEAVRLARTMAGALDYAHQRGVIHRDLKPENVLLQAGQPVIADFGIALAVAQAGGQRVTQTGLSLGTPQYMSPEQASGDKQLDGRTDVYALGAMAYEMLTGEPPHLGQSAQAIIAKLMTEDVRPLTVLRRNVPPAVDVAVRRALEKLPADRFATAGAFATALGDGAVSAERYLAPQARGVSTRTVATLAAVALLMTAVAGWSLWRGRTSGGNQDARVARLMLKVDPDGMHALGGATQSDFGQPSTNSLALSPDGQRLVYAAWDSLGDGHYQSHLYLRRLGEERVTVLAGTEGGAHPTFSPDGQWVAFTTATGVARARVDEGTVQVITPAADACCLAWGADDHLVYVDSTRTQLWQVPATGGRATRVPVSLPGDSTTRLLQPLPLPSGALLFHARISLHPDSRAIYRLDRATGKTVRLLSNAADPKVVGGDFLVFLRQGALMTVRVDLATGTPRSEPVRVVDDVMQSLNMPNTSAELGIGQYAVSARGDLVYARGGAFTASLSDLVVVKPNGAADIIALGMPAVGSPRISPTGDRIAFHAAISTRSRLQAIFVHDRQRRITTKVAEGGVYNALPQWSTDGRSIAFSSDRGNGVIGIFSIAANGSGAVTPVVASTHDLYVTSWSATGAFAARRDKEVWVARAGEPWHPFFTSPDAQRFATFSPDGNWLAYASGTGSQSNVFIRPCPAGEPAVQISGSGGVAPAWSADGHALYYLTTAAPPAMLRVPLTTTGGTLRAGSPTTVFARWPYEGSSSGRSYDVLADGSLLGVAFAGGADRAGLRAQHKVTELHVVLNFLEELRARVK